MAAVLELDGEIDCGVVFIQLLIDKKSSTFRKSEKAET